jgi:hypothetical protein
MIRADAPRNCQAGFTIDRSLQLLFVISKTEYLLISLGFRPTPFPFKDYRLAFSLCPLRPLRLCG